MNELEVAELFRRAGTAVEPDVARLVSTGIERGAVRRRRRAVVTSWAVAAALAVVAVPTALVLTGRGGTSAPVAGSDDDAGNRTRQVAVAADDMGATLAGLLPGATVRVDDQPYQYQVQRGVVEWHGVEVALTIDSRGEGAATTARERCETFAAQPCTKAPDGGWLTQYGTIENPGESVETYSDVVRLDTPEGYTIEASGERGEASTVDQGGGSDADPALLRRLIVDDVWLR